uniref:CSON005057 protein n=1 Tax=Culicoides sonorensis TaxID=179676 RepID=A0A336MPN1_CULSO
MVQKLIDSPTLAMECEVEDLTPEQKAAYDKAIAEHSEMRDKLNDIVIMNGGEKIYSGNVFTAYQIVGASPDMDLQFAKELAALAAVPPKPKLPKGFKKRAETPPEEEEDDEYIPLSKRIKQKNKEKEKSKPSAKTKSSTSVRPTENTAVGGLQIGAVDAKKKEPSAIVDLTKDDKDTKPTADSREVTFSKLQGKTFPSLVVVARPSLRAKDGALNSDRPQLDAKVKTVLMHTPNKFTEWLIQQGLVRSEQSCAIHSGQSLKLGMYSDATKFPYSGGYVWISECCPNRFVSVFNGSLFEASPHPPATLLKLLYHWTCQTNVQNVIQWVKIDNLYVKQFYTWIRAACTIGLHKHGKGLLGGPGKKVEVGVISLGTTTQDGQQRQVKVEVLGVLDPETKHLRLRAIEPLTDGERNYKKRFAKILEPLSGWVNKDSNILTDLTVDKGTLNSMGYKSVTQVSPADANSRNSNANIMDYLRRIVPRMFQNTLSLLSRQIIQQFLDELVWREWFGTTQGQAFDNIVLHLSEQTRYDSKENLITRLNRVSANPFKDYSSFAVVTGGSSKRGSKRR